MQRIPIGYKALVGIFNLKVIPNYCWSYLSNGARKELIEDDRVIKIFPKSYGFENIKNPFLHLEFALKYEGVNLEIIKQVFEHIEIKDLEAYIKVEPLGKPQRKLWYIYELLFELELNIDNLSSGNYVDLLSADDYFTCPAIKSARHRINDNLLGNGYFCPFVRKTETLNKFIDMNLGESAEDLFKNYPADIIKRAVRYFYLEETISTWQIEREMPSKEKETRFVNALQHAFKIEKLNKSDLIELQNIILDQRYANQDYRQGQIFVGKIDRSYRPIVHFVPPLSKDLPKLMSGLLLSLDRMLDSDVNPVIIAASIAFGFVFVHPFQDGNGRIHRFLIHYILSKKGFTPKKTVFPISAIMLENIDAYINVLESFSDNLISIIDYQIDEKNIVVNGETCGHYAYLDYTKFAEYLFECVEKVVTRDFRAELNFIENYDKARSAIQDIVDMPDRHVDLIIKLIVQGGGRISATKRDHIFESLTDSEVSKIEAIVSKIMLTK